MHMVSANYTVPTILNALQPAANTVRSVLANATTGSTTGTTGTSSSSNSSTSTAAGLGSTFLSLLAQELQNQDPTAPVDPTQMVGQMISLNQLQQLIDINQFFTSTTTASGATPSTSTQPTGATPSNTALTAANSISGALAPAANGTSVGQLPFDPNTMMPLGYGNSAALAASLNSALNPATMGMSGSGNNSLGGR